MFEDENQRAGGGRRDLEQTDAYDYDLPEELVAAHPVDQRDESRLLVARRQTGEIEHRTFADLVDVLDEGDLLVFNDTRVNRARIHARKKETGGAVELLVLDVVSPRPSGARADRWSAPAEGELALRCMTRSSRPLRPDMPLELESDQPGPGIVVRSWDSGRAVVEIDWQASAAELMEAFGRMPLPPYILRRRDAMGEAETSAEDTRRYQTVFADTPGAVAAPTAGLHFTEGLLEQLDERGVERAFLTLRVGPGTFRPVTSDTLSGHDMHSEAYEISDDLADAIERTRSRSGRVVAVGTTSTRALESEARRGAPFTPGRRSTDLFLKPGSDFEVVDALVTNFHLPRSTLLALVAAFAGYDFMRDIYEAAVRERYRFYSYGDSMIIL